MSITAYRLYCQKCDNDEVIRDDSMDDSSWKVESIPHHEGLCPKCNPAVKLSEVENSAQYERSLRLEDLDNIGTKAAQNLSEAGYDSAESIAKAYDEEILDVAWVGEKALFSLKEAAKELTPQKRWDE